jgi:hypothetical protein
MNCALSPSDCVSNELSETTEPLGPTTGIGKLDERKVAIELLEPLTLACLEASERFTLTAVDPELTPAP